MLVYTSREKFTDGRATVTVTGHWRLLHDGSAAVAALGRSIRVKCACLNVTLARYVRDGTVD